MASEKLPFRWKNIQASMALEGHILSDEAIAKVAKDYEDSGLDLEMDRAVALSEQTGRPLLEVLKELHEKEGK